MPSWLRHCLKGKGTTRVPGIAGLTQYDVQPQRVLELHDAGPVLNRKSLGLRVGLPLLLSLFASLGTKGSGRTGATMPENLAFLELGTELCL